MWVQSQLRTNACGYLKFGGTAFKASRLLQGHLRDARCLVQSGTPNAHKDAHNAHIINMSCAHGVQAKQTNKHCTALHIHVRVHVSFLQLSDRLSNGWSRVHYAETHGSAFLGAAWLLRFAPALTYQIRGPGAALVLPILHCEPNVFTHVCAPTASSSVDCTPYCANLPQSLSTLLHHLPTTSNTQWSLEE